MSIVTGLTLYSISTIPFGALFELNFLLFSGSLSLCLIFLTILLFRSNHRSVKYFSFLPAVTALVVILLTVILVADIRILYFQSLPPEPDKTEWISDLHALSGQMAEKHGDLYALISPDSLKSAICKIEERIPKIKNELIPMEFFRLAALPNDCHTFPFVMLPAFNLHSFPFKVFLFPDGLYIVNAGRGYEDLIGARVLKIGKTTIDDIFNNYPIFLAAENLSSYKERFTYMVMMAEWLQYHGIIEDTGTANFEVMKPGGSKTVMPISSVKFYPHFLWLSYFPIPNEAPPVFTNFREDYYHYNLLDDRKTLYIQFNQCMDQPGRETASEFTSRLKEETASLNLNRCIIDLRNNDGGSPVWIDLLQFLRERQDINRYGSLFVLIGRRPFSSAVVFATRLQLQTNAIFVGEATGQGPVFYSRPGLIELPHSRLPFSVSRELTVAGIPFDHRPAIEPDIPVTYLITDFLNGNDPVLDTALLYDPPPVPGITISPGAMQNITGRYLLTPTQIMDVSLVDDRLKLHFSDYLESGGFKFQSDLYPVSDRVFATHLKDVNLEIPEFSETGPDSIILDWMGDAHILKPAPANYTSAFEKISHGDISGACDLLYSQRHAYLAEHPDLEPIINRQGYVYLRKGDVAAAIQLFHLNVELFPQSYNVYDSYGESLMVNNQIELAIMNYRKSLELNPDNQNAARVITRLTEK